MKEILDSTFKGNEHTEHGEHGNLYEPVAKTLLEEKMRLKIEKCGLFIHPKHPYLAASPDGTIKNGNHLVEVKCPSSLPLKKSLTQGSKFLEERSQSHAPEPPINFFIKCKVTWR